MSKHYSVRSSVYQPSKFKIVLAGGFWGYEDIDLPLFDTLQEALDAARDMNALKKEGIR